MFGVTLFVISCSDMPRNLAKYQGFFSDNRHGKLPTQYIANAVSIPNCARRVATSSRSSKGERSVVVGGRRRLAVRDHDRGAHRSRVEKELGKAAWQVNAAVRRWIAGHATAMQGDAV